MDLDGFFRGNSNGGLGFFLGSLVCWQIDFFLQLSSSGNPAVTIEGLSLRIESVSYRVTLPATKWAKIRPKNAHICPNTVCFSL